jgi:hypothetical protein
LGGTADDRGERADRVGIEAPFLAQSVKVAIWARWGRLSVGSYRHVNQVIQRGQTLIAEVGGEEFGLIRLLGADAKANLLKRLGVAGKSDAGNEFTKSRWVDADFNCDLPGGRITGD